MVVEQILSSMHRMLLSNSDPKNSHSGEVECNKFDYNLASFVLDRNSGDHAVFLHIYSLMVYVALIWIFGKIALKCGMPGLVGEIICGLIFGPFGLNFVADSGSLIAVGEIGLIMLVVEAGLDVDIGMLKLIGLRGLSVAIFGSMLPLCLGTGVALLLGETFKSAVAIGACFAPTSMGIALNVLKSGGILSTPTGQLIIAAAILDDVIALMLLSELRAIATGDVVKIILPLVVSPVLIVVIGMFAIFLSPICIRFIMSHINAKYHENAILMLLFCVTFALVPGCYFVGSSYLLGAFLSGLMFCTDHTIHLAWKHQIKRVLAWMLRIFFSSSIGFAVPINKFTSTKVIVNALIYTCCIVGKLATGIFASPLSYKDFYIIAFSMSAWGEFAFILANASAAEGTFSQDAYASILLAVLLSVIISPYCLSFTVNYFKNNHKSKIKRNIKNTNGGIHNELHNLYFIIEGRGRGKFGHQDKLLHCIYNELGLEVVDFRTFHAPEFNYNVHKPLTKESFCLIDMKNQYNLPLTHNFLDDNQKELLVARVSTIYSAFKNLLGDDYQIQIKRWLPGVSKSEDDKIVLDVCVKGVKKQQISSQSRIKRRRSSYCRREAFKQANAIMSLSDIYQTNTFDVFKYHKQNQIRTNQQLNNNNKSSSKNSSGSDLKKGTNQINIRNHLNDPQFEGNTFDSSPYSDFTKIKCVYGDQDDVNHTLKDISQIYQEKLLNDNNRISNFNNNNNNLSDFNDFNDKLATSKFKNKNVSYNSYQSNDNHNDFKSDIEGNVKSTTNSPIQNLQENQVLNTDQKQ